MHGAAIQPLVSPWFWTPSAWCCYTAFGVSLVLDTQCMVLLYGLWCLLGSGHPVHGAVIGPLVSPWFWTPRVQIALLCHETNLSLHRTEEAVVTSSQ